MYMDIIETLKWCHQISCQSCTIDKLTAQNLYYIYWYAPYFKVNVKFKSDALPSSVYHLLSLHFSVGFPFGSALYQFFGRAAPFLAMGVITLIGAVIRFCLMPVNIAGENKTVSYFCIHRNMWNLLHRWNSCHTHYHYRF